MKSIKKILLIFLAFELIAFIMSTSLTTNSKTISFSNLNNSLKSKLQSKAKTNSKSSLKIKSKSKSNEEYSFSSLFGEPVTANKQKAASNTDKKAPANTDKKAPANIDKKAPANTDKIGTSSTDKKGKQNPLIKTSLDNWLKISSKIFKNPALHPEINYDGENYVSVKADFADFRLNDAYKKNESPEIEPKEERDFWFRLRKNNIYYSNTKDDLNILGEMRFEEMDEVTSIEVTTNNNEEWKMCSNEQKIRNTWVCSIQSAAKKPLSGFCDFDPDINTKIIIKNLNKIKKNKLFF